MKRQILFVLVTTVFLFIVYAVEATTITYEFTFNSAEFSFDFGTDANIQTGYFSYDDDVLVSLYNGLGYRVIDFDLDSLHVKPERDLYWVPQPQSDNTTIEIFSDGANDQWELFDDEVLRFQLVAVPDGAGGFTGHISENFTGADTETVTFLTKEAPNIIYVDANGTGDFNNIQAAIDYAYNGDEIIVYPGIYTGDGNRDLDFKGKAITVRSTNPEDLDVVGSTIINCQGSETEKHRGFYFHNNETADSVLDGFAIIGGYETSGGAINCHNSSPTIRNCILVDNSATYGGGISNYENSATVVNCIFVGNSASDWGGGLYNRNCTSSSTVTNCIFIGNNASWGGGFRNYTSDTTLINCIFIDNTASDWEGGGVSNRDGANSTLVNCTLSGNSSVHRGGGIYSDEDSSATITNCILWKNSDAGGMDEPAQTDHDGPTPVINYSCIQGWTGDLGGVGNISDDPCFIAADNNDFHLLPDSPCVDAGDNTAVTVDIDLDGNPRIVNGIVDMGAYEFYLAEPGDLVAELAGDVIEAHLPKGIENSLFAKLETALRKLADDNENNDKAAINSLKAFINAVEAQSGKKIPQNDADNFIAAAQQIINILSGE